MNVLGQVSADGLWEWDGQRWAPRTGGPPPPPAPRDAPAPPTDEGFPEGLGSPEPLTVPRQGWRLTLHRLTRINLGPSAAELHERELVARVRARISGCRRVAIISRKGGIGKTTTIVGLGHIFASHRGDRVVALDANPDAGSLASRVERETASTLTELLAGLEGIRAYSDLRAHTSQAASRLEVVASDNDPAISEAVGEEGYRRALGALERFYNLILVDTGTGVLDPATQGILRIADQLVVCAAPSIDGGRVASLTLDWLNEHGYAEMARQSVVVMNQLGGDPRTDAALIERHFARRTRALVRVPWDPHLARGGPVEVDLLRPATRLAYLTLAAAVADGFGLDSRP
ncbi:MAG: MinD/ParA family protein [Candidatus Dormibacteraeota bacterium]|nr:MinD/ParA family protein [Candidatus Dormibacteraeota bacterium]